MRASVVALWAALMTAGTARAACWDEAGRRYGVDPRLLVAIAKVESDFDARAVNRSHERRTGSVDLGLMQINSRWLPRLARYGITREGLLEPCTSVMVGAWILADLFARYGITWEAVGAYNAACTALPPRRVRGAAACVCSEGPCGTRGGLARGRKPAPETSLARSKPMGILTVRLAPATQGTNPHPDESAATRTFRENADG